MAKPNKRLQKFIAAKQTITADQKQQIAMLRQRSAQISAVWLDWFNNHPNNPNGPLYHFDAQGQLIRGFHRGLIFFNEHKMWGNCSRIFGVSHMHPDKSLHGDVSGDDAGMGNRLVTCRRRRGSRPSPAADSRV